MTLHTYTDHLVEIMNDILSDIPKVYKNNKSAAQRIRVKTIEFTKVAKEWRRESIVFLAPKKKIKGKKSKTLSKKG